MEAGKEYLSLEERLQNILEAKELKKHKSDFIAEPNSKDLEIRTFKELVDLAEKRAEDLNPIGKNKIIFSAKKTEGNALVISNGFDRVTIKVSYAHRKVGDKVNNASSLIILKDVKNDFPTTATFELDVNDHIEVVWKTNKDVAFTNEDIIDHVYGWMIDRYSEID